MVWVVGSRESSENDGTGVRRWLVAKIWLDRGRCCEAASVISWSPRHTRSECAAGWPVFDGMGRMVHATLAERTGGERESV